MKSQLCITFFAAVAALAHHGAAISVGDQCTVDADLAAGYINFWSSPCVRTQGRLYTGNTVQVLGKGPRKNCQGAGLYRYYLVEFDGQEGYVAGDFLDCESIVAPAPAPFD